MTLIYTILFLFFSQPHPLHLSITNIDIKKTEKQIEVHFKIFEDDFNNAINQNKAGQKIDLSKQEDLKKILNYLNKYFSVEIDKHKLFLSNFEFSEKKTEEGAVHLQFRYFYKNNFKVITVKNSLLQDLFPDQKNMVIFRHNDKENGFILDQNKTTCELKL